MWLLMTVGFVLLFVVLYSFLVISGENVYRVVCRDANGKEVVLHISASNVKGAVRVAYKAALEESQILDVTEVL